MASSSRWLGWKASPLRARRREDLKVAADLFARRPVAIAQLVRHVFPRFSRLGLHVCPDAREIPLFRDPPDCFVVGFGFDHNQIYRNLGYLAVMKRSGRGAVSSPAGHPVGVALCRRPL
jgi:hypothetical protein